MGNVPRVPEKRGLLKEIRTLFLAEVDINLLEMVSAIVAGDTGQVNTEKNLPIQNCQLVMCVKLVDLAEVVPMFHLSGFAFYMFADNRIYRCDHQVALG